MTIISNSGRFIFIHIHKTAGTSFKEAFSHIAGAQDIIINSDEIPDHAVEIQPSKVKLPTVHSSFADIYQSYPKEAGRYDVVVLVRDPIARIASLFKWVKRGIVDWCIANSCSFYQGIEILKSGRSNPYFMRWSPFWIFVSIADPLSFNSYIRGIELYAAHNRCNIDPALRPMLEQIVGVSVNKLNVFKSESDMEMLEAWVNDRLGINSFRITNLNQSNHDVSDDLKLNLSLDDFGIQSFASMYGSDYRFFKYSCPKMLGA